MLPLKEQIKQRDKCCLICGSTSDLTVDHIIPLAEGGADTFENLRTLCFRCNTRKGPIPPLWQRIVNLFNGNFYWFKNDIRGEVIRIKQGNEKFYSGIKQSLQDLLKSKFQSIDDKFKNQEATNKILIETYNKLLKEQQNLVQQILITQESIVNLQTYLKIEWNAEKQKYIKKNVHSNRRNRQDRKDKLS